MKIILTIILVVSFMLLMQPQPATAQLGLNRTNQPGGIVPARGDSASTLSTIIRNLVTLFYSIGSLGFTVMVLWGSVNWVLSGGDKEKIAGARKKIMTAVMGIFLLALSFPIIALIAQISGIDILGNLPLRNLSTP